MEQVPAAAIVVLAVFLLIFTGLMIWSLVWVHGDAQKRGHKNPGLVVLLVFLCNWPISLILYLMMRASEASGSSGPITP
ncbi:MAG: hypothetical protein M5R36_11985 [Deltaproteobacteria bacterium]|nr:hypothetical protein [Deltaproteobacteria bacterium]